jgi:hypothetical protein
MGSSGESRSTSTVLNASDATARSSARSVGTLAMTRSKRSRAKLRETRNASVEPSVAHVVEMSAPWSTPPKSTPDESARRNVSGSRQSSLAKHHAAAK